MKKKVFNIKLLQKSCWKNAKVLKLNFLLFISIQQKKTVINHKFGLDKSFQEILYRIDNWISKDLVGLLNQSITVHKHFNL